MKQNRIITGILMLSVVLGVLFTTSCSTEQNSSADLLLQKKTEAVMQEANREIGLPNIVNFQEKKVMKQIYELRDQEKLICHAYLFNKMTGEIGQYLGQCIGYGIPYSTQFSNPERFVAWEDFGRNSNDLYPGTEPSTIAQPEPNGLFMPEGLSATWLLLIDPETKTARPVYVEPEIIVSPFKLH